MIDWYTLVVPIAVLAVLMLFRFVGCGFEGQNLQTDDPYDVAIVKDQPVFYYRLQEVGTVPPVTTATDHD